MADQADLGRRRLREARRRRSPWLAAWLAKLPVEAAKWMSECGYLGAGLEVGPNANEAEVCEEASRCVGKAEEHGGGSCRTGHDIRGWRLARDPPGLRSGDSEVGQSN